MKYLVLFFRLMAAGALCFHLQGALAFKGVFDTPAQTSRLASAYMLNAVAWTGECFVAVGPRGHVLLSSPQPGEWEQAKVPVSADLTAVHFVSRQVGWAVGHGATVLRTLDGGRTWSRQLDGRAAAQRMVEQYQAAFDGGDKTVEDALAEARRFQQEGPGRPLLDVWFRDEKTGFVVGAFNLIFRTDDGGETWESWFHRTENPKVSNLYAVTGDERTVYIAGEQGLLLKLDEGGSRFRALRSDYAGTYFGAMIPRPGSLLVYGMRGNAYLTSDDGMRWQKLESGDPAGITGGTVLSDGRSVLVSQSGRVLALDAGLKRLDALSVQKPMSYTGVVASKDGQLLLVGLNGARFETVRVPATPR